MDLLADIERVTTLIGHELSVDPELTDQLRIRPPHHREVRPGKTYLGRLRLYVAVLAIVLRHVVMCSDGNAQVLTMVTDEKTR